LIADDTMDDRPDDLARLLHETLETLGWDAEPAKLAAQVKRLDIGLPAEDEFSVICAWLGNCELIHKLDQHQMPLSSKDRYQVPDLLIRFKTQTNDRPVLIEVKSKADKKLSFTGDYLQRLKNYADLMGMPLLIAWRFHSVWMLFEVRHLAKAVTNYNINLNDGMRENLLGVLAGDFGYKIGHGAGVHFRCDKEQLVSEEDVGETVQQMWKMRIGEVAFTDRTGSRIDAPSPETQTLFGIWDLEEKSEDYPDYVHISFTAPEDGMQFAHSSLVKLLNLRAPEEEKFSWRRVARKEKFTTIEDFRGAVTKAMYEKVVHFIINPFPHTVPDFVEGMKEDDA